MTHRYGSGAPPGSDGQGRRAALAVLVATCLSLAFGCKESSSSCPGGDCAEAPLKLCVDRACDDDSRCVLGACSPACSQASDCDAPEVCADMTTDYGTRGTFCIDLSDTEVRLGTATAPSNSDTNVSVPAKPADGTDGCTASSECSSERVEHCVDGTCRVGCLTHAHCGAAGACTGSDKDAEGNPVRLCEADTFPRGPGRFDASCVNGNSDCASGFYCVGAGEGDVDSYCTTTGCQEDAECPTGYYCDHRHLRVTPPCDDACGIAGNPREPSCIPSSEIGEGKSFQCAPSGIEFTQCLRKEFCAPCETDDDCNALPGQICAAGMNGSKQCTELCDPAAPSCPWGSASACGVWDQERGVATCAHRAGACQATGNSCDPCLDDRDCPNGFCSASVHTRERYCYDGRPDCSCLPGARSCAGGGCPSTPGGLTMTCYVDVVGLEPNSCFSAAIDATDEASRQGCWPE